GPFPVRSGWRAYSAIGDTDCRRRKWRRYDERISGKIFGGHARMLGIENAGDECHGVFGAFVWPGHSRTGFAAASTDPPKKDLGPVQTWREPGAFAAGH